jgi:predicted transposase YdaD
VVDRSVQTDPHRKEWMKMSQTIAEMYLEQGRVQGRVEGEQEGALKTARGMLLRLLRKRFKKVPRKVEAHITATTNMQELETWIENFATAATLAEVGIPQA